MNGDAGVTYTSDLDNLVSDISIHLKEKVLKSNPRRPF